MPYIFYEIKLELNIMNQKQFKVQFSNSQEIRDIRESVVFKNSLFLQMIDELNPKGETIHLDVKVEDFDKIGAFILTLFDNLKCQQENNVFNNLEDLRIQELSKDLFKDLAEKQILQLLSVAEYLDIPGLIVVLTTQFSSLIKDHPTTFINQSL
ncbi:unnamed protein product [Paramecium sonneborni]|uniref:Uncharacterized protein n=1 Tax=Paramecium sonneborni TaxID=65129 RepID=A0A8S1KJ57_9CILI|nr:unnamed protein product [Paramecium sonneborni]CAD8054257.1 unnamed protein product [Paramecium sonneborni]